MEIAVENQKINIVNLEKDNPNVYDALYCEKSFNVYIRKNMRLCVKDPKDLTENKEIWKDFEQDRVNLKPDTTMVRSNKVINMASNLDRERRASQFMPTRKHSVILDKQSVKIGWNMTKQYNKTEWLYDIRLPILFNNNEIAGVGDYNLPKFFMRFYSQRNQQFWTSKGTFITVHRINK